MTSYSVSAAKNRLSALLARVRRGARIVITDRGIPVALLVPPDEAAISGREPDARLAGLERAGLVTRRRTTLPAAVLREQPPAAAAGASAVAALLSERAESR